MKSKSVLFIDDDEALLKSFGRLAEKNELETTLVLSGDKALKEISKSVGGFDYVFVDCVLPEGNGLEISKQVCEENGKKNSNQKVYLMSGIVTSELLKEGTDHVDDFLAKPIDSKDFQKIVGSDDSTKAKVNFQSLFSSPPKLGTLFKIYDEKTIESGLDLIPLIFGLSWLEYHGEVVLNIGNKSMKINYAGKIKFLTGLNKESSMGEILVHLGYLRKEDLEEHLNSDEFNSGKLKMGEALKQKNYISPHSLKEALTYQFSKRLSTLMIQKNISVSLNPADENEQEPIDEGYTVYDLFSSLHAYFDELKSLPESSHSSFLKNVTTVYKSEKSYLTQGYAEIDYESKQPKDLYLLLSTYAASLKKDALSENTINHAELDETINRIENETPYELFDLNMKTTTDQEIAKKYHIMARKYHPDKISNLDLEDSLRDKATKVFSDLTNEFNKIKTTDKRKSFQAKLENMEKKKKDQLKNLSENLYNDLYKSEIKKSQVIASKIRGLNLDLSDELYTRLLLHWSDLASKLEVDSDQVKNDLEVENYEEGIQKIRFYVQAQLASKKQEWKVCANYLKKCLGIDSSFLPARRDLTKIKSLNKPQKPKKTSFSSIFSFKKSS